MKILMGSQKIHFLKSSFATYKSAVSKLSLFDFLPERQFWSDEQYRLNHLVKFIGEMKLDKKTACLGKLEIHQSI